MAHHFVRILFAAWALGGCAGGPKAEPNNQASIRDEPSSAGELLARGREAARRGDAVRAEQYLALAIQQGADPKVAMPILLQACIESSHLRAALNHAEPYLLDYPEDDTLRVLVATIHLGLGEPDDARRELFLLLQSNDANPDAHYLLGIISAPTDIEDARTHFLSAIEHSRSVAQRTELRSRLAELELRQQQQAVRGIESEVAAEPLRANERGVLVGGVR